MNEEDYRDLMSAYLDKVGGDAARKQLFPRRSLRNDKTFIKISSRDLEQMVDKLNLDIDSPLIKILLVQSSLGHAQNGHGEFGVEERIYPHATIPDVIHAAGLDIEKTKEERQRLIDEVYTWVDAALDNKAKRLVLKNKPLLGINFLRDYHIDQQSVLKGMVLAGYMDNFEARQDTIKHFRKTTNGQELVIGGGETHLVNPKILFMYGLDFDFLAQNEHDDEALNILKNLGIIREKNSGKEEGAYIRRKLGAGTSDDLAFIMIGKRYGRKEIELGISAMLGAFVVDAIDTYDKCVKYPVKKGLDEQLAELIETAWKSRNGTELVTKQEKMDLIYYSAKRNIPQINASSSHRRLVQLEGDQFYRPVLLSHMAFVKGEPTGNFRVGFSGTKSKNFYEIAEQRVKHMLKNVT